MLYIKYKRKLLLCQLYIIFGKVERRFDALSDVT